MCLYDLKSRFTLQQGFSISEMIHEMTTKYDKSHVSDPHPKIKKVIYLVYLVNTQIIQKLFRFY